MKIEKKEILDKLITIFENDLRLKPKEDFYAHMDNSIFLAPYGLQVPQLLLLFDEIEKQFSIKFDEKDIVNGAFMNINSIVEAIEKELENTYGETK